MGQSAEAEARIRRPTSGHWRELMRRTPTADHSCLILSDMLRERTPFCFLRFGDADVPWMLGAQDMAEARAYFSSLWWE